MLELTLNDATLCALAGCNLLCADLICLHFLAPLIVFVHSADTSQERQERQRLEESRLTEQERPFSGATLKECPFERIKQLYTARVSAWVGATWGKFFPSRPFPTPKARHRAQVAHSGEAGQAPGTAAGCGEEGREGAARHEGPIDRRKKIAADELENAIGVTYEGSLGTRLLLRLRQGSFADGCGPENNATVWCMYIQAR